MSRKRSKASDIVMAEDDSTSAGLINSSPPLEPSGLSPLSYASILTNKGATDAMEVAEFSFSDGDCSYSSGQHGTNIQFAENVLEAFNIQWRFAVIINLMGKPNSVNTYDFILRGLRRKWKSRGGWKLIDLPNDYFVVKFDLEADMNEALCGVPWILAGQTLVVRKWRPDFDARTDTIGSMAVWTRIIGLPIQYFNKFALCKIGKLLGDVVKVDVVTLNQERGRFARICIEMDLGKPFKPSVEVDGVEYGVKYEGLSMLCFNCGIYGHATDKCTATASVTSPLMTMDAPGSSETVPLGENKAVPTNDPTDIPN